MTLPASPARRRLVAGAASGLLLTAATRATAHGNFGLLKPPLPLPAIPMLTVDNRRTTLTELVQGKVTAMQFFFTGCSATCPMQGALFEEAQAMLPRSAAGPVQLLSISIDPLSDTPAAMRGWLKKFHAGKQWSAAAPLPAELDRLSALMQAGNKTRDRHTTQVYMVDSKGQLVFRTYELPDANEIATVLAKLS